VIVIYGFVGVGAPVWLLSARDYLSTFMKVGAIALLAIGICFPTLSWRRRPSHARHHRRRSGFPAPVPFLFITIACGALSGFHRLISSGQRRSYWRRKARCAHRYAAC